MNRGKYTDAAKVLESTMDKARLAYEINPKDTTLAISLGYLGLYHELSTNYEEAEKLYKEAIEIRKKVFGELHPEYRNAVGNLGILYVELGRYLEAEPLFILSRDLCKRQFGENNAKCFSSMNNLAELYRNLNRYEEAQALYLKNLEITMQSGLDSLDIANAQNNLAIFYFEMALNPEAEFFFKKSLEIRRRHLGENHRLYASSLSNLAALYGRLGRYNEALALREEGMRILKERLGENHLSYASSLNNLAKLLQKMGRVKEVEELLQEGLKVRIENFGKNNPIVANSLINLGHHYKENGRYQDAEIVYQRAVEIAVEKLGRKHSYYTVAISSLASVYQFLNQYEKAEPLYEQAIENHKNQFGDKHPFYTKSITELALMYHKSGRHTEAASLFLKALENKRHAINENFPSMSQKEKIQFWRTMEEWFDTFNSFVIATRNDDGISYLTGHMFDNQLALKSSLLNGDKKVLKSVRNTEDSALISLYDNWTAKRSFLSRVYTLSLKEMERKKIDLERLKQEINELEKELAKRSTIIAKDINDQNITWQDIQKALKPKEAAIELVRFKGTGDSNVDTVYYAALIVTPEVKFPELVLLKNGVELETELLENYRNSIMGFQKDTLSFINYWKPIGESVRGIEKVYFSANGVFNLINLNTIYNPETNNYLIDEINFQLLTSTKDILEYTEDGKLRNDQLDAHLFGNPTYNIDNSQYKTLSTEQSDQEQTRGIENFKAGLPTTFKSLPYTEREIKLIEKILSQNDLSTYLYIGTDASEEHIKELKDPTILHIATHGFFAIDSIGKASAPTFEVPSLLSTGLILSGITNYYESELRPMGEDGMLTSFECTTLDLDRTELVVLSACDSGLGELGNSEGVYGLQKGFKVAGAKSILMSLWQVSDLTTQELMTTFYEEWLKSGDKLEAFRYAQQKLRKKYPDPYYWGGFVMVGNNTKLDTSKNWIWVLSFVTVLIVLLIAIKKVKRN